MSGTSPNIDQNDRTIDPWLIWFICSSALLIFISLFLISSPAWHLLILGLTLVVLWKNAASPLRTLTYILGLVIFLAILQITFSPFMRDLFTRSLEDGFQFSDWQYLLFAVERFAWPLVIVSSFQSRLTEPAVLAEMTSLLSPLKWLGLKIGKLQILVMLALRFIPSLRLEWERFTKFQTYFSSGISRETLVQKAKFWVGVFKAMLAHTIHRSLTVGDLLAMRGLPSGAQRRASGQSWILLVAWVGLGGISFFLDKGMGIAWGVMSFWLMLVTLASSQRVVA